MGALLVTVDGPSQRRQLSLPDDWPIRDLMPVLVDFVGEGGSEAGLWILHSGGRRLPEDQSLTACGVGDGATLVLDRVPARIPLRPDDVVARIDPALWKPSTDPVPSPTRELHPPQPAPAPTTPASPARPTAKQPPKAPGAPASGPAAASAEAASPPTLPQGRGGPAAPPAPPRQSQPSSRRGRRRAGVVGAVAVLALAGGGAWWAFARPRPRPQPPAPPRVQVPVAPPTRGLPPIAHLSAVVHGTIVGTDSIQVGYFARTPEGATEAGRNYLWALAGTDDASTLLKQIAVSGQARALVVTAQENKDLLLEQFYLGFRNAQPQLPRYTLDEATITVPVVGQTFLVYLRWVPDPTGGDWKLTSVQRLDPGAPPPQPAPS